MAGRTSTLITAVIPNVTSETSTTIKSDHNGYNVDSGFVFEDFSQRLAVSILTILISLAGIIGNVLVLFAVSLSRKLQTKVNVFVVNLSISDSIISLVLPFSVVALLSDDGWPMPDFICSTAAGVLWISLGAGTVTLALIAFNRYYVIKQYNFDKAYTSRRIAAMVAFAWLYPATLTILATQLGLGRLGYSYKYKSCLQDSTHPYTEYLSLFAGIVIFIPCLLVIIICYIRIFLHVRKHNRHLLQFFITDGGTASHWRDSFRNSSSDHHSHQNHSLTRSQRLPFQTQVHFNSNHTSVILSDNSHHNHETVTSPSSQLSPTDDDKSLDSPTLASSVAPPCPSLPSSSAEEYPDSSSEMIDTTIEPHMNQSMSGKRTPSSSSQVNSSSAVIDIEVFDVAVESEVNSSPTGCAIPPSELACLESSGTMSGIEVPNEGSGTRIMSSPPESYSTPILKTPGASSSMEFCNTDSGIGPRSKSVTSSSTPASPSALSNVTLFNNAVDINQQTKTVSEELSSSVSRRQADITRNVFYVVCAFLVCLTPYGIAIILPDTEPGIPWLMLLLQFNTCVNPVIYALKHPTFREVIPRILRCDFANIPSKSAWLKKLLGGY